MPQASGLDPPAAESYWARLQHNNVATALQQDVLRKFWEIAAKFVHDAGRIKGPFSFPLVGGSSSTYGGDTQRITKLVAEDVDLPLPGDGAVIEASVLAEGYIKALLLDPSMIHLLEEDTPAE